MAGILNWGVPTDAQGTVLTLSPTDCVPGTVGLFLGRGPGIADAVHTGQRALLITELLFHSQEAKLLVAKAYRHTEQVLQANLDKLQAVRAPFLTSRSAIPSLRCVDTACCTLVENSKCT